MKKMEDSYLSDFSVDSEPFSKRPPEDVCLEDLRDISSRYNSTCNISCWGLMDAVIENPKIETWPD